MEEEKANMLSTQELLGCKMRRREYMPWTVVGMLVVLVFIQSAVILSMNESETSSPNSAQVSKEVCMSVSLLLFIRTIHYFTHLMPGGLLFSIDEMPQSRKPKSDLSLSWLFCLVSSLSAHQLIIIASDLFIPSLIESHL